MIDASASVAPFGDHGSGQAAVADRAGDARHPVSRPTLIRECPFCAHRAGIEVLAEHVPLYHRERLAAAAAYQKALAQGADLDAARATYNKALLAAFDGRGPGHYRRAS